MNHHNDNLMTMKIMTHRVIVDEEKIVFLFANCNRVLVDLEIFKCNLDLFKTSLNFEKFSSRSFLMII